MDNQTSLVDGGFGKCSHKPRTPWVCSAELHAELSINFHDSRTPFSVYQTGVLFKPSIFGTPTKTHGLMGTTNKNCVSAPGQAREESRRLIARTLVLRKEVRVRFGMKAF